jgi:hypothetical protein
MKKCGKSKIKFSESKRLVLIDVTTGLITFNLHFVLFPFLALYYKSESTESFVQSITAGY